MSTEYEPEEKPVQERRDSYEYQFTAKKLNVGTEAQDAPSRKFRHPFHRDMIDSLLTVINKDLLFCKLFYFFFFGAFGSLFPLLAIYFKQLGMSASQSGVLIGFRPFIEFLSVPFWTGLADKWRRGKEMLLFSLLCWVVFTLAIAFVRPPAHKCLVYNGTHTVMEIPYATRRRRDVTSVHLPDEELRQYGGQGRRVMPPDEVLLTLDDADHLFVALQVQGPVRNGYNLLDPSVSAWAHASQPSPFNPADDLALTRQRRASAAHRYKVDHTQIANANASDLEGLITSKFSTVVYKQDEVQSDFFVLLLIVILGEFFSAPAITFADCVTLSLLGEDTENYGRQRMFGSLGWGLAMFFVGMALDHATTFPQHPCGVQHPAEKNYTVCFATFSVLMSCAFLTALQFRYHFHGPARDIALSQLTEKVKDKAKRIITGRKKIDRERLVEEDTDEEYGPNPGPGQGGYGDGGSGYSPESARKPVADAGVTNGDQKLRIKPSLKNDMVTDALRAPGASAHRAGGPYHNTKGSAVPPGQYSSEPFFGKWKSVVRLLWSYQYLSVLFVAWFMGFGVGLIFTFLFWHLQDLGGSPTLFGVASVINHVSELFAYFMGSKLLTSFGHVKVLYAGLLGNVARFLYISWLRDPYWVLPFEFVQGLTHAAVWAACCAYITSAIPGELKSSAQGILQALHHGLGRGCGAVFGGLMVSGLGSEVTFRAYGVTCIFVLIGYAGVNLYLQRLGRFSHSAGLPREVVDDTSAHLAPHGVPSGVGRNLSAPKLVAGSAAEESAWNVQPKADYGATTEDETNTMSEDKEPWGAREGYGSSDSQYRRDNPFQQQSFDHSPYQEQGKGYQEQGKGQGYQEQGQGRGRGPIYTGDAPRMDTQVYRQQANNYYDQGYGP